MEQDPNEQMTVVYCPRQTIKHPQFDWRTGQVTEREAIFQWIGRYETEDGARRALEDFRERGCDGSLLPERDYATLCPRP